MAPISEDSFLRDSVPDFLLPSGANLADIAIHSTMPNVSINRVAEENRTLPRRTAAILVGHGNEQNPASASAVYHLASIVRACGCPAAEVHCAFLSQPPLVQRWGELTDRPDVIIVPCFLTVGVHIQLDLSALLRRDGAEHGSLAEMRRLWITPPLATHCRGLADVIRDLISRTPGTP